MIRWNPTQAELNRASACRAFDALGEAASVRDAIRPLFRKRVAMLAAMIEAQPIGERRTLDRRANRSGR